MATSWTEATGTLSNAAATVFAANTGRRGLVIGNPSDTAMTVRFGGTASATAGLPIPAGATLRFDCDDRMVPNGAVSLFCAGASKAYVAYEC